MSRSGRREVTIGHPIERVGTPARDVSLNIIEQRHGVLVAHTELDVGARVEDEEPVRAVRVRERGVRRGH